MSFLPRLFRSVLPTSQHPFSPQLPTSVASSAAGPSRIQWYHGPKIQKKQKTNKAAAARFKLLKSGEILRRRVGGAHYNTMWSVERLARLKIPVPVSSQKVRKTIKRMIPFGNR